MLIMEDGDDGGCGLTILVQIKYFKEKRVMEYKRDATIANIKEDDAKMAAKARAEKKKSGGVGGWFS